ncbi:molybdopterin-dependent oxidoreductase [Oxalobacteraceae bacterium CAVE-383]|nr:molybdopterin-dependent oxidoreductase [Oxalobacteraceae bacterium CAVE-383]
MRKRNFLFTALGIAAAPVLANSKPAAHKAAGPTLLTVSGAIGRGNRGALDPALDQMMHKQGVQFERARVFDFDALAALPAIDIAPTLEYDARRHALRGPLLSDVIGAATEKPLPDAATVKLRAVDGYVVQVSMADLRKYGYIAATHLDGNPMPLGGLGPLWAVYEADRFPEMTARPLPARFTQCPWALYHIEVQLQPYGMTGG